MTNARNVLSAVLSAALLFGAGACDKGGEAEETGPAPITTHKGDDLSGLKLKSTPVKVKELSAQVDLPRGLTHKDFGEGASHLWTFDARKDLTLTVQISGGVMPDGEDGAKEKVLDGMDVATNKAAGDQHILSVADGERVNGWVTVWTKVGDKVLQCEGKVIKVGGMPKAPMEANLGWLERICKSVKAK